MDGRMDGRTELV